MEGVRRGGKGWEGVGRFERAWARAHSEVVLSKRGGDRHRRQRGCVPMASRRRTHRVLEQLGEHVVRVRGHVREPAVARLARGVLDLRGRPWQAVDGRGRSVEGRWKVGGRSVEGRWKVCGRPWKVVEGHGHPWKAVAGRGRPWTAVDSRGRPWKAVEGRGRLAPRPSARAPPAPAQTRPATDASRTRHASDRRERPPAGLEPAIPGLNPQSLD